MRKILVIEDEELLRESVLHLLNINGFNAIGAANGSVGVRLAREVVPDLVLCDVRMPGINGYDVLKELRNDPITAKITFIFVTAQTTQADFDQGQKLGANGYLRKPFSRAELLEAIALLLK